MQIVFLLATPGSGRGEWTWLRTWLVSFVKPFGKKREFRRLMRNEVATLLYLSKEK